MLHTIEKLPKWNGHLYNWYNTINLEPLIPRYISTVDSGNLVGYLFVLKQFLDDKQKTNSNLITIIDRLIENTNFKVLYDYKKRLFSIGFNIEENELTDSYYDLLASEARQASLVAIAKRDVPSKHWNALSRTLTSLNGYKGLISWSGTTFEYLMPSVNIKTYEGSLIDESCRFMIMSQKQYAKKIGTLWGISEAAFSLKDLNNNYQYKAFGIPWLGLKRGLDEDIVISPYSVFLSLTYDFTSSLNNIRKLEKEGMVSKYGFYESIDYTVSRLNANEKKRIVKTYMAHHQGLILLSINNCINNNILVKRFSSNPEIEAVDILLQERMPKKAIVTKEKKEKIEKLKMKDYQNYVETVFTKPVLGLKRANVISNGEYTICNLTDGRGYSKYKDILINRFKETADYKQGKFFYVRNLSNNQILSANIEQGETGKIIFAPDVTQMIKKTQNLELKTLNTVSPDEAIEIKRLEITNNNEQEETLEIINYFEPILCTPMQEYSHPAFNNLFITYEKEDTGEIIVKRKKRGNNEENIFLGVNLITESKTIGTLEFEIDKEKFIGQGNIDVPNMIMQNKPFSNSLELVTESILATKKIIKVGAKQKAQIDLILCVSENKEKVKEMLKIYNNTNATSKIFELSRAKIEAESIYLGLKGLDIEKYQKMLSFLLFQNPMKSLEKVIPQRVYSQSDLWKFGISGDLPILLVKIKDINEKYILKDLLKAYDFYRNMNIKIELVILNKEVNSYENNLENEINKEIQNKQIMFLKNCYGGIFVINENEITNEDINLLEFRANLIIDGNRGSLNTQLKDLEEEYTKNYNSKYSNSVNEDTDKEMLYQDYSNLKYYNEYGGFTEDGLEYKFRISHENKLPTVWSMVLANPKFGTIVTQNLGGFTWSKNSRLNRISSWNNTLSQDIPSEIIYLEDLDNYKNWNFSQNLTNNQEYHLSYGFGYINLKTIKDEILQELTQFIPMEDSIKVNLFKFKNTSNKSKNLNIYYYIKPVLGEDESKTSGYIYVEKNNNIILATNMYKDELKDEKVFLTSSEKIIKYTGNKQEFIGGFNLQRPKKILRGDSGLYRKSCIAMQISLRIKPYETKEFTLCLGVKERENEKENNKDEKTILLELVNVEKCKEKLQKTQKYWYELLGKIHVNTPIESINIILNGWGAYQSITSRLWAKSGYYQSGGAIGFRDQLQDTLGLKYLDVNFMKNQILINAKHQFIEGDVEHWWHEETGRGIRTRFSDDLLWLPYVTSEYIEFTGDYSILDEKLPYLNGKTLEDGIDEKYDKYEESNIKEPLFNHCIRAIEKALNFGENGLPKIGSGDWNDGMNTVGNKEKGESVWLGFFLYNVLDRFINICKYKYKNMNMNNDNDEDRENDNYKDKDRDNDKDKDEDKDKRNIKKNYNNKDDINNKIEKYEKRKDNLKHALNKNGWDGRWFKRAFTDDGISIGSIENEECRIDSISQSWGVISGAAENTKQYMSMENLENNLIDKENGLIKLLDPPFEKSQIEPGYIKAYLPGVRENGGQYTHAAIWVISAFAKLGLGDKAVEYYTMINPIEHSKTKDLAKKYKVEPYVIPADIYEAKGLEGRGGWTWYTGSASWFCKVGLEDILGLNVKNKVLELKPCISKDWKEYSIRYKYGNTIYNIKVKNPNGKNTGVEKFILNGQEVTEKKLKLVDDGEIKEIEVIM